MTRSESRLGVGVASLLIWLVLALLFSLGVARGKGWRPGNRKCADQGRPGGLPAGWREGGGIDGVAAKTFEVKRASDNVAVFSGAPGLASADADSGDSVQIADFTKLREAGTYDLDVPGVGRSWTFAIKRDVPLYTYYLAMRAFYGQRCGPPSIWVRNFRGTPIAACHIKGEFHSS